MSELEFSIFKFLPIFTLCYRKNANLTTYIIFQLWQPFIMFVKTLQKKIDYTHTFYSNPIKYKYTLPEHENILQI